MDLKQARVTVVVRIRPPENAGGGGGVTAAGSYHDIAVFPAVASQNTIVVDRDGTERRKMGVTSGEIGSIGNGSGTTFTFDRVFWSMQAGSKGRERQGSLGRSPAPYASQNCVFEGIGRSVVENCLSGFNTCLFAYGQTGSGKTFTMMGAGSSATAATTTAASGMAQQARAAATPNPAVGMTGVEDQHRLSATAIADACSHGRKCHTTNIRATSASSLADGDCVISSPPIATDGDHNQGSSNINSNNNNELGLASGFNGGVGNNANRGVIPRICDFLFERARLAAAKANANATAVRGVEASGGLAASTISSSSSAENGSADGVGGRSGINTSWSFGVSFTEIYMERVRDLLDTSGRPSQNLKVREHPTKGPFVEGALTATVTSARETERLLVEGQARRAVAGTNMNDASSRSHAIFTILVTKVELDLKSGAEGFATSKVNLVDLAGSENSNSAGSAGTRLKEGAAINKSLLTLGRVIKALVDSSLEVQPRASQCRSPSKADQQTPGDVAGDGGLADPPNSRSAKVPSSRSLLRPPSPTQSRSSAASATSIVCDFTPTSTIGPAAAAAATSAGEIAAASEEDFAENNRASTSGGGRAVGHSRRTTLDRRRSSGSLKQQLGSRTTFPSPSPSPSPSPLPSPTQSPSPTPSRSPSNSPRVSRRLSRSSSAPRVSRKDGGGDDGGGGVVRHSAGGTIGRVPYRESVLTFLLKDSLGGNSHTTMIATIRPGVRYLEETMSTLRYADQAKSIVNAVKVNEDPFARTVRRLHEEIHALKRELAASRRKEALAVAQADGLRREIDLLQVVDATLLASIKRHETNGEGQSVKLKEPRSLDGCGDPSADQGGSRHGSSAADDGFFNDITPQLTPMPPTPIAAELDEEDEGERVRNTAGPGIHRDDDGGERCGSAGGGRGRSRQRLDERRAETALWRKSSLHDEEAVDSSSIENDTSKHVMGDVPSDEIERGDHSQVEHMLSLDPETKDNANSGRSSSDPNDDAAAAASGAAAAACVARRGIEGRHEDETEWRLPAPEQSEKNPIDVGRTSGGASVDGGTHGVELGQGLRPPVAQLIATTQGPVHFHPQDKSTDGRLVRNTGERPSAAAAVGAAEQYPSPEYRWSGDGPEESAAATAASKGAVDDDSLARRGVSVLVDNSDSIVVSVGDVGASNTMVETASHDDKKRGVTPSLAADRSDERHHQPSRAALDLERSPFSLLSRGALVEAAVAVARARYHGRKDEKYDTLQASSDRDVERAEVVTLLAVVLLLCETSDGAEPSERGDEQSGPRVVLEEATTVVPVEPALAPVAVNSHTPEKSAASGSEQVSTTRELHVEASGELRTVEKQSPEATHVNKVVEADGEEGILEEKRPSTEGIECHPDVCTAAGRGVGDAGSGQVSQTRKIISPLPISPRSSDTARDAAGLPCEASTGGPGTGGGTRRRTPEGKAKQGLDGTRKTGNAKGPKQVERGRQRGQEPFMQPRSSGLFETSGFLLGQSWPPLPGLAPSMLTASVAAADNDGSCNTEEAWVRRWYILQRGKLTAFSGWGGGHSCVGRMLLEGCSVEDAPEKAPAGTPFTFCVRAQQQQCGRDGDGTGQAWTLQASNREEKCRWVNAIRGAADRDIDLSPPEFPLDDDRTNLSPEARTTRRREPDGPSGWDDAEGADEEKPAPVVEQGRIMDTLWMSAVARRSSQGSGSGHARRSSGNFLDVGTTGTCREGEGRGKDEVVSLEDEIHEEAVGMGTEARQRDPPSEPKEGFPAWPKDERTGEDVSLPDALAAAATTPVTTAAVAVAVAEAAGTGGERGGGRHGSSDSDDPLGRGGPPAGFEPPSDVANAPTEGPAPTEESGEEWGDEGQVKSCVFQ